MRKLMVGLAAFAIIAAACAPEDDTPAASDSTGEAPATAEECVQGADIPLTTEGALTIGTGNPAYAPWYGGKSVDGSEWESSSFTGDPHEIGNREIFPFDPHRPPPGCVTEARHLALEVGAVIDLATPAFSGCSI